MIAGKQRRLQCIAVALLLNTGVNPFSILSFVERSSATTRRYQTSDGGANDNEDVGSNKEDGDDGLSKKFYDQLRQRQQQLQAAKGDEQSVTTTSSSSEDDDENYAVSEQQKFTGASPPSLFKLNDPSMKNVQKVVVNEREMNLVSVFELTLPLQFAAIFAAIVFVASVGLTGGITDGSDRFFGGFDEIPQIVQPLNMDLEVGKVSERSVFL